jgi:hypothetical protein
MSYSNSRNSFSVRPLCFRMSASIPLASEECIGTTVLKTLSVERFSKETWLPFWRNSTKPARLRARITRSPETLGNFATSVGDFDRRPEFLRLGRSLLRRAPGFQIQLDGFAQVSARAFHIAALRSHAQLRASRDVKLLFLSDQNRESIGHMAMLADVAQPGKQSGKAFRKL